MAIVKTVSRCVLAVAFVFAGILHFSNRDFYMKIMPPYLPLHLELVYLSGVFELVLGVMLLVGELGRWSVVVPVVDGRTGRQVPLKLTAIAAWGLILLLIAVFPANIYVYQHQDVLAAPPLFHLLRLPLQGFLILWAWWHTRPAVPPASGT